MTMNQSKTNVLSNNHLRRLKGWARSMYPGDWTDRCAVLNEYLAQLDEEACARLIRQGWPEAFAAAERDWPEAFAGLKQESAESA